jgi:uncharacterized protein (DUF433 family)
VAKLKFDPTTTLSFVDPRETPSYSIPEAAHYLRLPAPTLRSWLLGRYYPTESGRKKFAPLIDIADPKYRLLSFINLAEAHVLNACRRYHKVRMDSVRAALDYVAKELKCDHPLVSQEFETDGVRLFITRYGKLIDASSHGQEVMRDIVKQHLKRLERENDKIVRLYPFTRPEAREDNPRSVFIDPRFSFGRMVLARVGVPTAAFAERLLAGESIEHLADDYGCETSDVEEAIRCEIRTLDAAA